MAKQTTAKTSRKGKRYTSPLQLANRAAYRTNNTREKNKIRTMTRTLRRHPGNEALKATLGTYVKDNAAIMTKKLESLVGGVL